MSYILAGIKEAYFGAGNIAFPTLDATLGTTIFGLGIRNAGNFTVAHVDEMTDKSGRKFPNLLNFKADLNTFQINDMVMLQQLISASGSISKLSAATLAIVTGGASSSGGAVVPNQKGGVFVFDKQYSADTTVSNGTVSSGTGEIKVFTKAGHGLVEANVLGRTATVSGAYCTIIDVVDTDIIWVVPALTGTISNGAAQDLVVLGKDYSIGCDWELILSMKERLLKLAFEKNMKYSEGMSFLHNAGYRTIDFLASNLPDIDATKVVQGYVTPSFIPSALSAYYDENYLTDWSMSVKAKSSKNGFGVSMISGITVEMKATASGADYAGIKEVLRHEVPSDITIDLDLGSPAKTLVFKQHGLTKLGNVEISDEKREATFTMTGEYDIDFVTESAGNSITFNTFMQ